MFGKECIHERLEEESGLHAGSLYQLTIIQVIQCRSASTVIEEVFGFAQRETVARGVR